MSATQGKASRTPSATAPPPLSEAESPGGGQQPQEECPFCVMMRRGGCETPFNAFMDCGQQAEHGQRPYADCISAFEALKACMEKNKEAYDEILKDMQDGEGVEAMLGGGGGGGASEDASSSSPQTQEQQQQQELARGSKAQSQRAAAGDETSAQNGSGLSGPQAVPSSSLLSGAAAARTRPQH